MGRLDLNMDSQDPQLEGDRELLMNSQEIPLDTATLVIDNPHDQDPVQLEDRDLVTVSPVTVKGIQKSHRDSQNTPMNILGLPPNIQSLIQAEHMNIQEIHLSAQYQIRGRCRLMNNQDPEVQGKRYLSMDTQETNLHTHSQLVGRPHLPMDI